jgi:hypothetical protein
MLQSSFVDQEDNSRIIPRKNGFVDTVVEAYNKHHALVVRPDDVWLAILTQFNFFVNGNADTLRSHFVAHEGKKHLVINAVGNRYMADFGAMARQMTALMQANIADPHLHKWIMPEFSTTTQTDTTVSAIVMMATMKTYFSYEFGLCCGIPRVTLEGERGDWEEILVRLDKLKEYGIEAVAWYHLLVPVISRFVKAFDDPDVAENIDFWQRVAHYEGGGSGPSFLMGWITAFCAFDADGKWLGNPLNTSSTDITSLSAVDFWRAQPSPPAHWNTRSTTLTLDGTSYHSIDTEKIPCAYAEVDVKLNDNGVTFETVMTAGIVGSKLSSGRNDTLQPVAGWWMFIKRSEADMEAAKEGGRQADMEVAASYAMGRRSTSAKKAWWRWCW